MNHSEPTQLDEPTQINSSAFRLFVNQLERNRWLSTSERIGMLMGSLMLAALVATAAWLSPNISGIGTHRQLGLPECTVVTLFHVRCPGCGMTTSWAHLLNGNVESAIQSNVAGVLLCMLALFSIPMLAYFAIIGRSSHNAWFSQVALIWCVTAAAIAIIEWAIRLAL